MNPSRHDTTDQYGQTGVGSPPKNDGQRGVVFDPTEVKKRLHVVSEDQDGPSGKPEPTLQDLLDNIGDQRRFVGSLEHRVDQLQQAQQRHDQHFAANVREVVAEDITKTHQSLRSRVTWSLIIGVIAFVLGILGNIVGWSALTSAFSVKSEVVQVKQDLAAKADRTEVAKLSELLLSKADKSELKAIAAKADKSVVERLSDELKTKDGAHDQRLNDLATDLMSKADKAQVAKLAARLRSTRAQVNVLQKRVQDLQDAAQPPPAVNLQTDERPKTM